MRPVRRSAPLRARFLPVLPVLGLLAGVAAAAALHPSSARAQQGEVSVDGWFGLTSPKGDLGDVNDSGWATGIGGAYRVLDRVSLRLDGTLERTIQGPDCEQSVVIFKNLCGPDAYLWHATASLQLELTEPGSFGEIALSTGGGWSRMEVNAFREFPEFRDSALTWTAAIFAGVEPTDWLTAFARMQGFVMIKDEGGVTEGDPLGREATLVNALGVRVTL